MPARAGRPGAVQEPAADFRSRVRLTPRTGSWPAGLSRKILRGRTDSHSPGTPRRRARGRPTSPFQAGSPDSSSPRRQARSPGTHRWYGPQAPSRRALATSRSHPARSAAGGGAAGCRTAGRRRRAFDAGCAIAHHLHALPPPLLPTTPRLPRSILSLPSVLYPARIGRCAAAALPSASDR